MPALPTGPARSMLRRRLRAARIEVDRENLGDCPYYWDVGTCIYSCYDEPACITSQPSGGWPRRLDPYLGRVGAYG